MKDWLNDKKNLPIIGAVTGVILVAAIALVYMTTMRGSSSPEQAAPTPPAQNGTAYPTGPPEPGPAPAGMPGAPPYAATPAPTTTVQPATATTTAKGEAAAKVSLLPSRGDPFLPFDYKPPPKIKSRIVLPPIGSLFSFRDKFTPGKPPEGPVLPPQPIRRMAGVMHNGRVYAILETGGETLVVKPGDIVENGDVRVDAIQPDRVLLSWLRTPKPIPIEVRLSEGTPEETTSAPAETGPFMPPTPGYGGGYGRRQGPASMTMPTD